MNHSIITHDYINYKIVYHKLLIHYECRKYISQNYLSKYTNTSNFLDIHGVFDAYICQVLGYNYSSFKKKFTDESWSKPIEVFIDRLQMSAEYEKIFGNFYVIVNGKSAKEETKRNTKII